MFKKGLVKKVAVLAMMGIMSLSLAACGDDSKKEEKATTEATSEVTTEDTTEATSEDVSEDTEDTTEALEDGKASFQGVSFVVPEGFAEDTSSTTTTSVTYVNETDGAAFLIAVDNANAADEAATLEAFDAQIASVFGDQCTSSEVSYNGYKATEWVTDAADDSYDGRSMVICDGSTLIYVEYVTYYGTLDAYSVLAESLSY